MSATSIPHSLQTSIETIQRLQHVERLQRDERRALNRARFDLACYLLSIEGLALTDDNLMRILGEDAQEVRQTVNSWCPKACRVHDSAKLSFAAKLYAPVTPNAA